MGGGVGEWEEWEPGAREVGEAGQLYSQTAGGIGQAGTSRVTGSSARLTPKQPRWRTSQGQGQIETQTEGPHVRRSGGPRVGWSSVW
jgi:hypothetical protein